MTGGLFKDKDKKKTNGKDDEDSSISLHMKSQLDSENFEDD